MSEHPHASFPNYLEMRSQVPMSAWRAGRIVSVAIAAGLTAVLVVRPATGLVVLWKGIIPVLPLVFVVAPGVWRNLCPLAAMNQTPRGLGISRSLAAPGILRRHGHLLAGGAFVALVASRKLGLDRSGVASALLLGGALMAAFAGGLAFAGKSGWCSTICPLLPVQRVYGQTPLKLVPNAHCRPCVGCVSNCYDFNPQVAYAADMADPDPALSGSRKAFAGAFPAVVLAFFTTGNNQGIGEAYLEFALAALAGVGSFFIADSLWPGRSRLLAALYGALALNLFYLFVLPQLTGGRGPFTWLGSAAVLGLTVHWLARTARTQHLIERRATEPEPTRLRLPDAVAEHSGGEGAEVLFVQEGVRAAAAPGRTLLEIAESHGLAIEAGCRMGMCGSDPVAVCEGLDNLSAPGDDERRTLERLGLPASTRMACCARLEGGSVEVELNPSRRPVRAVPQQAPAWLDSSVGRVVVVGNGIAGITAADIVRRLHPDCEVQVVAAESHHLYNRMGVSRLLYGRSAMQGLSLLPEDWHGRNRISCWLNTRADAIDRDAKSLTLATGEVLGYDRLILATGSSSRVPELPGVGADGCFVLRTADDALRIRAYGQECHATHAVVIGGGVLGLEAAFALTKLRLQVTVVHRANRLMSRQLDAPASRSLQQYLEGLGINVLLDERPAGVESNGRVRAVALGDGASLPADIVVVCTGIHPNVELARAAGLGVREGVVVDDKMTTGDASILAAGDAAEHRERIDGLWPIAVSQGEIAGRNALGADERWTENVPVTILKIPGADVVSAGQIEKLEEDDIEIALEDPERHAYRNLVIRQGVLRGGVLVGYPELADTLIAGIRQERDLEAHLDKMRAGDWGAFAQA